MADGLERWATLRPDVLALADARRRYSATELVDAVAGAVGTLLGLGIRDGDDVVLVATNSTDAVIAYHATLRAGARVALLDQRVGTADVSAARDALGEPRMALVPLSEHDRLGPALDDIPVVALETVVANPSGLAMPGTEPDRDEPRIVLFTSGTTARPKAVMHSLNTITAGARNMERITGADEHDVVFLVSPVASITGVVQMHLFTDRHCTLVLEDDFDPDRSLDRINQVGATLLGGAPVIAERILRAAQARPDRRIALRGLTLGGAMLPRPMLEIATDEFGIEIARVYGSSEMPSATGSEPEDDRARRLADDGLLMPGTEVRVGSGQHPHEGLLRGPSRFLGYVDPADNAAVFEDGWYRTGDLVELHDGRLTVIGRLKEVVNRSGLKIALSEVDAALAGLRGTQEFACFGLPDDHTGERLVVAIRPEPGAEITLDAVTAHLAGGGGRAASSGAGRPMGRSPAADPFRQGRAIAPRDGSGRTTHRAAQPCCLGESRPTRSLMTQVPFAPDVFTLAVGRTAAHRRPVRRVCGGHVPAPAVVPPLRRARDGASTCCPDGARCTLDDPGLPAQGAVRQRRDARDVHPVRRGPGAARRRGPGGGAASPRAIPTKLRFGMDVELVVVPFRVDDDTEWSPSRSAGVTRSGMTIPRSSETIEEEQHMDDVAIIGVGLHPFGRFGPKSAIEMGAEAIRAAWRTPRCEWNDVQFAFGGSFEVDNPDAVVSRSGCTGIPFMDVYNGCATAATALQLTADAIRSGKYDLGVAVGMDKHLPGAFTSDPGPLRRARPWYGEIGQFLTTKFFAMKINRYMHDHGISRADPGAGGGEELPQRVAEPERLPPQADLRGRHPQRRGCSTTRSPSTCSARPTKGPRRSCCAGPTSPAGTRRHPIYLRATALRTRRYGAYEVHSVVGGGRAGRGADGLRVAGRLRGGRHRSRGRRRHPAAGHRRRRRDHPHGGERLLRRRRAGEADRRGRDGDRRAAAGQHRRRPHRQRRAHRRVGPAPGPRARAPAARPGRRPPGAGEPAGRLRPALRRAGHRRRVDPDDVTRAESGTRVLGGTAVACSGQRVRIERGKRRVERRGSRCGMPKAATGSETKPTGGRSRKGADTRARLVQAAKEIFERDGFLEARITDIAQRAGVSHGSYYHYFESKEQLFREVAELQEARLTAPSDDPRLSNAPGASPASGSTSPIVGTSSDTATRHRSWV